MECMERFKRSSVVDLVVIIWKSSNFCGSPLSFKVFKALRRLPKRLKTLEFGDTHKNSNVPQMLFWLWGNRLIKKYFYWWTVRLHLNFYVHKNLKISCTFCLAKISMECMERFKRSKMWTWWWILQIFCGSHQFQSF